MSMFRNLMIRATESGPDTFICKIKNTDSEAVTPYIAFPVRSAYAYLPAITATIETSSGQSQTLTITGADLTTENDTATFALGRTEYFSAVSMAQDETATVTLYSKSKQFPSFSFCSSLLSYYWEKNARLCEVNTPLPVFVDGYCGSVLINSLLTSLPNDLFQYGGSIKELNYTFAYSSLVTVPADLFSGMSKVTKASYLFRYSDKLATLPEGLFSGMTEVTDLSSCFANCSALTSVPEGLFDGVTKVTNLSHMFDYCSSLVSIPTGLFNGMSKVTNLSGMFFSCEKLVSVPEGLFSGMTEVTDLSNMFNYCDSLTSIPAGLFNGMTEATNLNGMFDSCKKLASIPAGLFSGMTKVNTLFSLFGYCSALTSIPASLFREQVNATNFRYCFRRVPAKAIHPNIFCNEATEKTTRFANVNPDFSYCFDELKGEVAGTAPALWEYTYKAEPTKTGCFSGNSTTTLSNYGDIPTEWK